MVCPGEGAFVGGEGGYLQFILVLAYSVCISVMVLWMCISLFIRFESGPEKRKRTGQCLGLFMKTAC